MTHERVLGESIAQTRQQIEQHSQVLLVQDTTSFNFSHHPATTGLGKLENKHMLGFLAHTTLAVSTAGVPLGVFKQQVWVRDDADTGKSHQRHERAFDDKESHKWVDGLPTQDELPPDTQAVVVCDAEGHIYDLLTVLQERGLDYLIRAANYRSFTAEGQSLFAAVAQQAVQAEYILPLQRRPDREERLAYVQLRYGTVTLRRPKRAETGTESLTLTVVDVQEPTPPEGEKAVHWLLLTSKPVTTMSEAQQITRWYSLRWLIERFHYVLKSGCKLEDRQLSEGVRLERLLAVDCLVAWRLLWLTYQARQTPDAPCTVALSEPEWQALYVFTHRHTRLPATIPSLQQAVRWIAQLGGFMGRKGDGDPGVKVLWRGWARLQDITATFAVLHYKKDVGNV